MLHQCLQEPKETLFLQKRQGAASPREKQLNIAFNSRFQEKKSLKTVKSIRSHKSLKTIDSETPRDNPQIISMRAIQKDDKTRMRSPEIQKGLINLQSPFKSSMKKKEELNQPKCRSRIEKKLTFPLPHSINRVSIRFGDQITLRKFLSPQPNAVMEKVDLNEAPKTPQLPTLNLTRLLKRSSKLSQMKEQALSITFRQSPEQMEDLMTVCEDEKDWDMKSTHHVDQNTLAIPLPLPSKAKSTVSMISDRSDCDSVVMGRLPISGKITKLL